MADDTEKEKKRSSSVDSAHQKLVLRRGRRMAREDMTADREELGPKQGNRHELQGPGPASTGCHGVTYEQQRPEQRHEQTEVQQPDEKRIMI